MAKVWKWCAGYEGLYKVSSSGEVKSFIGKTPVLLSQVNGDKVGLDGSRYQMVNLWKNRTKKTEYVHRLVARTFIDKDYSSKGKVVNHKNFNRADNRLENLEVVSRRVNGNQKHIQSKFSTTGVYHRKEKGKYGVTFYVDGKQRKFGLFNELWQAEVVASMIYDELQFIEENNLPYDSVLAKSAGRAWVKDMLEEGLFFLEE